MRLVFTDVDVGFVVVDGVSVHEFVDVSGCLVLEGRACKFLVPHPMPWNGYKQAIPYI